MTGDHLLVENVHCLIAEYIMRVNVKKLNLHESTEISFLVAPAVYRIQKLTQCQLEIALCTTILELNKAPGGVLVDCEYTRWIACIPR